MLKPCCESVFKCFTSSHFKKWEEYAVYELEKKNVSAELFYNLMLLIAAVELL